jgi:hypothetical protein
MDVHDRFGARMDYGEGAPGLFMVVSAEKDPSELIRAYNGSVVIRLNGGRSVIARMTLPRALALKKEGAIRMVGGVKMNLDRYRMLLSRLNDETDPQEAPGETPEHPAPPSN